MNCHSIVGVCLRLHSAKEISVNDFTNKLIFKVNEPARIIHADKQTHSIDDGLNNRTQKKSEKKKELTYTNTCISTTRVETTVSRDMCNHVAIAIRHCYRF